MQGHRSTLMEKASPKEDSPEVSDRDLVVASLADPDNFSLLVKRYWDRLFRYVRRISFSSNEDIEDILQETFIKIYKNLNAFDGDLAFSTWAYQITRNCAVDALRKKQVRPQTVILADEEWEELRVAAEELEESNFSLEVVQKAIAALPLKYREPFTLFYFEHKTYEELIDILKKPKGTIASLLSRAKGMVHEEVRRLSSSYE